MTGIPEAIAALAGMSNIVKGLVSVRDEALLAEAKSALSKNVLELQLLLNSLVEQQAQMQQRDREQQQKIRELQGRLDAVEDYELIQLVGGFFVLATKPAVGEAQRPPYFCHACHRQGKQSLLHFEESAFSDAHFPAYLHCQNSKGHSLSLPGGTRPQQLGYAA